VLPNGSVTTFIGNGWIRGVSPNELGQFVGHYGVDRTRTAQCTWREWDRQHEPGTTPQARLDPNGF
jgi:hypothetical protein